MHIKLDIPNEIVEDLKDRNIRVFAGIDLIAEKLKDDKWKIKVSGCSMCGRCCKELKKEHPFPIINGQCVYLENPPGYGDKWFCQLGLNRPFGCAISTSTAEYCKVKYEYIKE